MKGFISRDNVLIAVSTLVLIAIWQIASVFVGAEILLPPPGTALKYLIEAVQSDLFWITIWATLIRGTTGFAIAFALGTLIGLAAGLSKAVFVLFQPFITLIRSTPHMSIILLALIWFGSDLVPVFVVLLIAFPIIYGNVVEGVKNADHNLIEMALVYKVKKRRIIAEVYLPSILPYLVAGVSTALGISWKVVISAEVLSHPSFGVGTQLHEAQIFLETGMLFAWTVVAIIIGFTFEKLVRKLDQQLQPWR